MALRYLLAIITGCLAAIAVSICLLFIVSASGVDAVLISALSLIIIWLAMSLYFSTLTIKQNTWLCVFLVPLLSLVFFIV